ncbi:MAG: YfiT family bacillithiol transferase [Mariniblastus sp.]
MISDNTPPLFPAGEFESPGEYDSETKSRFATELANCSVKIRSAIEGLSGEQLDTKYKNWTIRQIVHHLADSHMNAYIRFKWALTEASPLIKSYDETKWSEIVDAKTADVESSLAILDGLHARWATLVKGLDDTSMKKTFFHPEQTRNVSLAESLPAYVWHTEHHVAQIRWIRSEQDW